MSESFKIINPLHYKGWDVLLLSLGGHSFFHSQAWARVLYESYGYEPTYVTAIDSQGQTVVVPLVSVNSFLTGKRGVSLPFSDFCEPISSDPEGWKDIFAAMTAYGREQHWKYIEWRGGEDLFKASNCYSRYYVHHLDVSRTEEEIYASFRNSTKRNIKKALNEQIEIKISDTMEAVDAFYKLNCGTRKNHGLPPQPHRFFKNLFNHVISAGKGMVVLGLRHGKVIAAGLYLHYGDKGTYKYGASDKSYQYLRPNNIVMWEAIKWYSKNGYREFSFGRTSPRNAGLLQFKRGWGVTEESIKYFRYDLKKNEFLGEKQDGRLAMAIFKRLPAPALKLAGYLLYRHVA